MGLIKPISVAALNVPDAAIGSSGSTIANLNFVNGSINQLTTTAGTATALTATINGFSLSAGSVARIKLHTDVTGGASISINAGASVAIKKIDGSTSWSAVSGSVLTIVYNGTNFILQGDGGSAASVQTSKKVSTYELWTIGNVSPFYGR